MKHCRASLVGRMPIISDSALSALPIPTDALSIVIDNPSLADVLIRWGPTPVDPTDSRDGYDVAVPGPSLSSRPIPDDATVMSIAWRAPANTVFGFSVSVDTTGADVVTIQATPNNQGTFFGLYRPTGPLAPSM